MKDASVRATNNFEVSMELKMKRFQYEVRMFDIMSSFDGVEIENIE